MRTTTMAATTSLLPPTSMWRRRSRRASERNVATRRGREERSANALNLASVALRLPIQLLSDVINHCLPFRILGRFLNALERAVFSVLWSRQTFQSV